MSSIAPTSVLDQLLQPVTDSFTPEVARRLINLRADDATQARIDELADKCTEGELTTLEALKFVERSDMTKPFEYRLTKLGAEALADHERANGVVELAYPPKSRGGRDTRETR